MPTSLSLLLAACLIVIAAASEVAISKQCPYPGLCFQLNIPDGPGKSGHGDIYFQIRAQTDYHWVALGQGKHMADSNIFVLYSNGNGKNVSVSTRLGKAHVQPVHSDNAQITLLEGSGIRDGYMTANVRCSNCNRWPGGSMDFLRMESDWIYAAKLGEPLRSDDLQRSLHRHDSSAHFVWSLQEAKGGDEPNPFLTAAAKTYQGTFGGDSKAQEPLLSSSKNAKLITVHGAVAVLVFVILFPVGGILIRLANFRGGRWIHVGLQLVAWLAAIAAFGLGIYLAMDMDLLQTVHAHLIIGIIIMVLILGQPAYGWLHHKAFKAHGQRTIWSWAHLSVGRIAIVGGMINGGLGLKLAGHANRYYTLRYGVACGVIGTVYLAAIIYGELRLRKVKPGKGVFRGFAEKNKKSTVLYARSDEQGLAVPAGKRPFRLRRDDAMRESVDNTEYVPLAARELYADDAGSRAGSRAASPVPRSRAVSPEPRSRAPSTSRLGNTAYDP